jgi:hypothetical protein
MNSGDHVIGQAPWPERASVAHAVTEDGERISEPPAILPEHAQHLAIVARLSAHQEPEWDDAPQQLHELREE